MQSAPIKANLCFDLQTTDNNYLLYMNDMRYLGCSYIIGCAILYIFGLRPLFEVTLSSEQLYESYANASDTVAEEIRGHLALGAIPVSFDKMRLVQKPRFLTINLFA